MNLFRRTKYSYERLPPFYSTSEDRVVEGRRRPQVRWSSFRHLVRDRWTWLWLPCIALLLTPIIYGSIHFYRNVIIPEFDVLVQHQDLSIVPLMHPSRPTPEERAIVSTIYSDDYAYSVAVLGHSIRAAEMTTRMLLLYIPEQVSEKALCVARSAGWETKSVPRIAPPHNGKGIISHFADQYTKLRIWTLQENITAAVYLDGDTIVRQSFDELFESQFSFGAVPDVYLDARGFVPLFNAGVLVFHPDQRVFHDMIRKLETARYPLAMAEQSFLNLYFGAQVNRLPYAYNANVAMSKRSPAMWEALKDEMRIVHYTLQKPTPTIFLEPERMAEAIANMIHGLKEYQEEVGWWNDVWIDFKNTHNDALSQCFS